MRTAFKILKICCLALLLSNCTPKTETVTVQGTFTDCAKSWVYFAEIRPDEVELLDSVEIKDGKFFFKLSSSDEMTCQRRRQPFFLQIALDKDKDGFVTLVQNGDRIEVSGNAQKLPAEHAVTGGSESGNMLLLDQRLTQFIDSVDYLYEIYEEGIEDDALRERIEAVYLQLLDHHTSFLKEFIATHPGSLSCVAAFYSRYNRRIFLPEKDNLDLLKKMTADLEKIYPEHEYVLYLKKRIEQLSSL